MHAHKTAAAGTNGKLVAVLYSQFPPEAPEDEKEVLLDVEIVCHALEALGYETAVVPATLNLAAMLERLNDLSPLVVFNLVESLGTYDELQSLSQSVMEVYGIPFTGVSARGNFCTTDKIVAKEMLRLASLPTPDWVSCECIAEDGTGVALPCIVKLKASDASKDIDETAVCGSARELQKKLASLPPARRPRYFAEQYIDGREFAVSMLAFADGVRVLPPAETVFEDYPAGKYKVVDYRAKWQEDSFEYQHTVRRFDLPPGDGPLLTELQDLSRRCWELFGLCGYARVDFRVDPDGRPWILEINGNPCISPDAGFMAATANVGLTYEQTIQTIVNDALRRAYPGTSIEDVRIRRRVHRSAVNRKR